jgi:hypothetical protein
MNNQSENPPIEMSLHQTFFRLFVFFAFCISFVYTYELFEQNQTTTLTNQSSEASQNILSEEIFQEVKIMKRSEQTEINDKKMKDNTKNLKNQLPKKDGLPVFQVNSLESND